MPGYSIVCPTTGKRSRDLSPPIGQGVLGTIHRVVGETGVLAKLYINQKSLAEYKLKIEAMLAVYQISRQSRTTADLRSDSLASRHGI